MSPFSGALAMGLVIGFLLGCTVPGILDLARKRMDLPEEGQEVKAWEPFRPELEQSRPEVI